MIQQGIPSPTVGSQLYLLRVVFFTMDQSIKMEKALHLSSHAFSQTVTFPSPCEVM